MAYIKNNVVKMLWEADKFFEHNGAFVAAVQMYNDVPVVFKDNDAFLLMMESNPEEVADLNEIVRMLQVCIEEDCDLREYYEDLYVSLYDGASIDMETLSSYGIGTENAGDIGNRIMDIYPYYEVTYVENIEDAY